MCCFGKLAHWEKRTSNQSRVIKSGLVMEIVISERNYVIIKTEEN